LVDAGYPGYFEQIPDASEVAAVVVTHHHVDHAGTAEQVRSRGGATIYVDGADAPMVRGERRSHVPPGFYRQAWRPSMARYLAHTVAVGGARYRPVSIVRELGHDERLDVPGRPLVIHAPGHTAGHCSVLLDDRGVLLAGDAMVNFDYAAGRTGLRLHRFNEDRARAHASLERFDSLAAEVVLFGHGDPWTRGLKAALERVRSAEAARR
jgi:glyoxylase-like metal-dependent hydrolase (beta-lactamase superfamily II)